MNQTKSIDKSLDSFICKEKKNLYQKNFDKEISKHEQFPIKKSTSSTNLICSPSQSQSNSNYNSSAMFGDKTNHQKRCTQVYSHSLKEGCVACNQRKQDKMSISGGGDTLTNSTPKSNKKGGVISKKDTENMERSTT